MTLQFGSLRDFTDHLDQNAKSFPLKIMGEQRTNVYYTATMLAAIYRDTPDPDTDPFPWDACFGTIRRRGTVLYGRDIYSDQIVAAGDGSNSFQGDIVSIPIDLSTFGLKKTIHHAILVSHSCDISASPFITVSPAIFESDVDVALMSFLKGKQIVNPKAELQNLLRNEQHRFLGLPAHGKGKHKTSDEPIVVPLSMMLTIPRAILKTDSTVLRLTYRANAFLQMRLATIFMRDVQRSDETRDF